MSVAVVGVIGVILGALLTGVFTARLESRRSRRLAYGAARLIAQELKHAANLMTATARAKADKRVWWDDVLSTRSWDSHAHELVVKADDALWESLANSYDKLDLYNRIHPRRDGLDASGKPKPFPDELATELPAGIDIVQRAQEGLEQASKGWADRQSQARLWAIGSLAVGALLVGTLLFVPFPHVNALTVASEVRQELQPIGTRFVECDPTGEDWSCSIYELDQSGSTVLDGPIKIQGSEATEGRLVFAVPGTTNNSPAVDPVPAAPISDSDRPEWCLLSAAESEDVCQVINVEEPKRTLWARLFNSN